MLKKLCPVALVFAVAACGGSPAPAPASPAPPQAEAVKTAPAAPKSDPVTSCPKVDGIDCMPVVKPENQRFCEPKNREWIQANCPSIVFTD